LRTAVVRRVTFEERPLAAVVMCDLLDQILLYRRDHPAVTQLFQREPPEPAVCASARQ
jgi:hypothetical protein